MQPLQRRYNLPNCTLVLEGLHDPDQSPDQSQRLNILLNAEIYLAGQDKPLSGGKDFFTDLVTSVSFYAQECLSGVPRPKHKVKSAVKLQAIGEDLHLLQVLSASELDPTHAAKPSINAAKSTASSNGHAEPPTQDGNSIPEHGFKLTTVQLFDLVEAIDQFFADPLTLPDFTLPLSPVPKRESAVSREPLAQRVVAPTLGMAGLILAGLVFFFTPIPTIEPPEELTSPVPVLDASEEEDTPGTVPGSSENGEDAGEGTPESTNSSSQPGDEQPLGTDVDRANPPSNTPDSPSVAELEDTLTPIVAITDAEQLSELRTQLYDQINDTWQAPINFDQNLVYRVSVNAQGNIVGYVGENAAAAQFDQDTPLPALLYQPVAESAVRQEPLTEFQVIFSPSGELQVVLSEQKSEQALASGAQTSSSERDREQNLEQDEPESATTTDPAGVDRPDPAALPQASTPALSPTQEADDTEQPDSQPSAGATRLSEEITEPEAIEALTFQVYDQIDQSWKVSPSFTDPLVYRITVNGEGEIVESQPIDPIALEYSDELPLGQFQQPTLPNQAYARFRVVFMPSGVLEVSPWDGF